MHRTLWYHIVALCTAAAVSLLFSHAASRWKQHTVYGTHAAASKREVKASSRGWLVAQPETRVACSHRSCFLLL